ncbi:MAG: gliding motility-associated protein GldE [Bacteroidaceae bacterium]|nr:gliding motility-associated protein GldE [Bacteroidaceae bacterium]
MTAPTTGAVIAIILAVFLLGASAFVSGSEIAFFSLDPNDLNELEDSDKLVDKKIIRLREDQERLLATILISNNFVNVTIIMLCNFFFAKVFEFKGAYGNILEFVAVSVILTFLLLLFGEIMPKIFSSQSPLKFCRVTASGISFLQRLFWPIETMLMSSKKLTDKVVPKTHHAISVDDLEQALELTDKNEISDERNMLQGIIRFGDENVKEVMTPRIDVVDLDIKTPYDQVLKCIVDNVYSRIPVYQGSHDNVKGILYIKDLLPHLEKPAGFRWQSLIRPPYFVPETKKIDDLLRDFQSNKVHIAIVVDEFGGNSGIITLEDIIEEIFGEIEDEFDEEEKDFVRLNQNTFVFEAKTMLSDFTRYLKLDDEFFEDVEGDADTLAGLLLEIKGEFPKLHECIDYRNFTFEVLEMDERRILKIKVIVHKEETS